MCTQKFIRFLRCGCESSYFLTCRDPSAFKSTHFDHVDPIPEEVDEICSNCQAELEDECTMIYESVRRRASADAWLKKKMAQYYPNLTDIEILRINPE